MNAISIGSPKSLHDDVASPRMGIARGVSQGAFAEDQFRAWRPLGLHQSTFSLHKQINLLCAMIFLVNIHMYL